VGEQGDAVMLMSDGFLERVTRKIWAEEVSRQDAKEQSTPSKPFFAIFAPLRLGVKPLYHS